MSGEKEGEEGGEGGREGREERRKEEGRGRERLGMCDPSLCFYNRVKKSD